MRKILSVAALSVALFAHAVNAQSQFRQRIRHVHGAYEAWLYDDGGTAFSTECWADPEQSLVDGGSWPLKNRAGAADGGLPNPVVNTCVRSIEAANFLDGGLQ